MKTKTTEKKRGGKREGSGRTGHIKDAVEKKYRLPRKLVDRIASFAKRADVSQNTAAERLLEAGLKTERPSTDKATNIIECPCGHKWRSRSTRPRCSKCRKYVND